MEQYGSYEVIKELTSARGSVIHLARKVGEGPSAADGFVVKTFSSAEFVGDETQLWRRREHQAVPLIERVYANADAFLDAARKQQRAHSEGSLHVAPVLGFGKDERGAWYATRFYPRSIKKIIEGRVSLSAEGCFNVIRSITRGLLDFKRTCGQSHGNLKPSNILIAGHGKIRQEGIVLADPAPDKPSEHLTYEIADLHAIGEIMYQLTRRKEVEGMAHWPLLPSPEWSNLFGDAADAWRELCNKLLDPELSVHPMNLEELDAELAKLEPKPLISTRRLVMVATVAILVCVGGYIAYSLLAARKFGAIEITSTPSGAEVWFNATNTQRRTPYRNKRLPPGELNYRLKLDSYDDWSGVTNVAVRKNMQLHIPLIHQTGTVILRSDPPGAEIFTNGIGLGNTPLTNRFLTGTHDLVARYPGLKEQRFVIPVENQQTKPHLVEFPRGTIHVRSDPSGAIVLVEGKSMGTTPVDLPVDPGPIDITLQLDGYNTMIVRTNITNNGNVPVSVILLEGQGTVAVSSDPPGAEIFWQNQLQPQRTPAVLRLPRGAQELILRYQSLKEQKRMVDVEKNVEKSLKVFFPNSTLVLSTDRPGAQIFRAADLLGITPTNLVLDPGPVNLEFKLNDFSGSLKTNLATNQTITITVPLTVGRGSVYVAGDPPGANIFSTNGSLISKAESFFELPSGSQTLVARHPQHTNLVEQQFSVLVETGTIKTNHIRFPYGELIITSEPRGAALLQNGLEIGLTPYTNGFLQPGPIIYELRLENYQKEGLTAEIVAGQTNRLHKQLLLGTGMATFTSDPTGAEIFTNSILAGLTPLTSTLPAGTNQVMARFRSWPMQTSNLLVRLGETQPAFFYFPHGFLKIESDPPGATISDGKDAVGTTPTNLITPIGGLSFDLTLLGFSPTNLSLSIADQLKTNLFVKLFKPEFQVETMTNSIGMIFLKVPTGYWVGQSEVTLKNYNQLMGAQGGKAQENQQAVQQNWVDAIEFCGKLTDEDVRKNMFSGNDYLYSLPKPSEWRQIVTVPGLAGALRFGPRDLNRTGGTVEWCYTFEEALNKPAPVVSLKLGSSNSIALSEPKPLDKYTSTLVFRCVLVPREARFLKK